jgi:hypothetical protein
VFIPGLQARVCSIRGVFLICRRDDGIIRWSARMKFLGYAVHSVDA